MFLLLATVNWNYVQLFQHVHVPVNSIFKPQALHVEFSVSQISIPKAFVVVTCYGSILGHTMQSNAPTRKGKSPLQTTPFSFHSPVPRIIILLIICLTINKQKKWLNFQSYAKISKDPKYSKNSLVSVRFSTEATYSNTPSPSQVLLNY